MLRRDLVELGAQHFELLDKRGIVCLPYLALRVLLVIVVVILAVGRALGVGSCNIRTILVIASKITSTVVVDAAVNIVVATKEVWWQLGPGLGGREKIRNAVCFLSVLTMSARASVEGRKARLFSKQKEAAG